MADLDRLLERRQVVQGTLMRSTIHVVSRRDYWPFAEGIGPSRQQWWQQTWGGDEARGVNLDEVSAQLERELAGRVWPRKDLDAHLKAHGSSVWSGAWVPLVRVPPAGTWTHRRADLFQLSSEWLGPSQTDEDAGLVHLLRRYLGGFGPGRLTEAAKWAGVDTVKMAAAAERLTLRTFRTERGTELVDLPRAPLPDPATPAPVRFLPTWDATLLVHARRTEILPEAYRSLVFNTKTPHSIPTFLVDGQVAGSWKVERAGSKATLTYVPFERLPAAADQDVREEADGHGAIHGAGRRVTSGETRPNDGLIGFNPDRTRRRSRLVATTAARLPLVVAVGLAFDVPAGIGQVVVSLVGLAFDVPAELAGSAFDVVGDVLRSSANVVSGFLQVVAEIVGRFSGGVTGVPEMLVDVVTQVGDLVVKVGGAVHLSHGFLGRFLGLALHALRVVHQ